jgi:hypothetical protein
MKDPPVIAPRVQKGHAMNDPEREVAGTVEATLNRWEGEGGAVSTPQPALQWLDLAPVAAHPRETISYTRIASRRRARWCP